MSDIPIAPGGAPQFPGYPGAGAPVPSRYPGVPEIGDAGAAFDPRSFGENLAFGNDMRMTWGQISGVYFRSGQYRPPTEARGGEALIPYRGSQWVTPAAALAGLMSMSRDALIKLQYRLWESGFYGEGRPEWGRVDPVTRKAYMDFFTYAAEKPDQTLEQSFREAQFDNLSRRPDLPPEAYGAGEGGVFQPEITDEATLSDMIDNIGQELFGRFIDGDRKNQLIADINAKEIANQRQRYDNDQIAGGVPGGGAELDKFMAALSGQESGGSYTAQNPDSGAYGRFQIMPANWPSWAARAGLSSTAPRTPQNQEHVARVILADYYASFGNWRDVAIAWYAGPGGVNYSPAALGRAQGGGKYPSINQYADEVMARFSMAKGAGIAGSSTELPPVATFNADAEIRAAEKARDPAGWGAYQFAQRAGDFFSMLASPVQTGTN